MLSLHTTLDADTHTHTLTQHLSPILTLGSLAIVNSCGFRLATITSPSSPTCTASNMNRRQSSCLSLPPAGRSKRRERCNKHEMIPWDCCCTNTHKVTVNMYISGNVETVATPGFDVGGEFPSGHYQMYVHTYTHACMHANTHTRSHSCSMGVANMWCLWC